MILTRRPWVATRFRLACCAIGLGLLASVASLAAGLSLNVTPGLWEVSTSGAVSGMPQIPAEMLAQMKPEQRLMAQAMALAIVAQASMPHTMRFCVTPEQVQQGLDLDRLGGRECRRTIHSSSPGGLDMQVECGGQDRLRGVVRLLVVDRATVTGDIDVHEGFGGTAASIRQNVRGRWLGASCGDVPPFG